MIQTAKKAAMTVVRALSSEIVRWRLDYEKVFFPPKGKDLSPLEVIIPGILAEDSNFFFVQIGANNGIREDPLRSSILKYHLRGLLVEPLCDMFEELKKNYATEPQLSFKNVAIAEQNGEELIYRFKKDAPVPDCAHGMATFDKQKIQRLAKHWKLSQYLEEVRVKSVTFDNLLEEHQIKHISLLQIDTEGFDFEIIKMALTSGILPRFINYEFAHLSPKRRLELNRLLIEYGYCFLYGRRDTLASLTEKKMGDKN